MRLKRKGRTLFIMISERSGKMKLVTLHNIVFGYTHSPSLNGVSFEIQSGEFVGITGPNGASKSTMLRVMLGLLKPWEGTITISEKMPTENVLPLGTSLNKLPLLIRVFQVQL